MENYQSVGEALSDLKKRGYEADLDFETDPFCLYCSDLDMRLNPEAFHVDDTVRIDGRRYPDDNSTVYAISSYSGIKGTVVDAPTPSATSPSAHTHPPAWTVSPLSL